MLFAPDAGAARQVVKLLLLQIVMCTREIHPGANSDSNINLTIRTAPDSE